MTPYKSFSLAMKTGNRSSHSRDCYCDNCTDKRYQQNKDRMNSAHAREMHQIMTRKK